MKSGVVRTLAELIFQRLSREGVTGHPIPGSYLNPGASSFFDILNTAFINPT